jgi:outer membrane receptor protein involved in Fe transport
MIMVLAVLYLQGPAHCAEPSKVLKLDEITVRGQSSAISPPPPSATIITGEDLKDEHFEKPLFILEKVPGVAIRDYAQGAVGSQIIMRGVQLGHLTGAAFFVDGVPLNESTSHGDGYVDLNSVIPEDIDYIEVIKGPSSALYGQFARAGVINIVTKRRGNFNLFKIGGGTWDRQRFAMSAGREEEGFSKVFAAEIYRREGATEHSEWLRGNFTGKLGYDFSDRLRGGLAVNFNKSDWDHPEYLTRAQWDAGDYWSTNPSMNNQGGGERTRYGASNNWTFDVTDDDFLNFMVYGYRSNLTRYRDQTATVNEEYHDRDIYGGSASYVWNSLIEGMKNTLTAGLDGQVELTHTINAQNPSRIRTAREIITVDGDSTLNTYSLYLQEQITPTETWRITLGGRYDHMDGELHNHLTARDTSMEDHNVFSPKGSLEFTPWTGYTFFSTYGEGFRLPNGFDKFTFPELKEETYVQYELGLKVTVIRNLDATLTGFMLDVENEIVTDVAANTKRNEGNTRRKGVELAVNYSPVRYLQLYCSPSYTEAKYREYINNGVDYSGSEVPSIPEWLFSFGAKWAPPQGFFAGVDYHYVGEGALESYASNFAGIRKKTIDYGVTDVQLGYKYKIYSLALDLTNVFDKRYPSYEAANSLRTGDPRGAFLTFSVSY